MPIYDRGETLIKPNFSIVMHQPEKTLTRHSFPLVMPVVYITTYGISYGRKTYIIYNPYHRVFSGYLHLPVFTIFFSQFGVGKDIIQGTKLPQ